jgi:hypothetical protein
LARRQEEARLEKVSKMTVLEARKILGEAAISLTDEQINLLISQLSTVIEIGFSQYEKLNMRISNENTQ